MSSREYFVITGNGKVSLSDAEPEAFPTLNAARKRAQTLALEDPGETIVITRSIEQVICEVPPPTVRERKL